METTISDFDEIGDFKSVQYPTLAQASQFVFCGLCLCSCLCFDENTDLESVQYPALAQALQFVFCVYVVFCFVVCVLIKTVTLNLSNIPP